MTTLTLDYFRKQKGPKTLVSPYIRDNNDEFECNATDPRIVSLVRKLNRIRGI